MLLLQSSWKWLIHPRTVTLHSYVSEGVYTPTVVESCQVTAVDWTVQPHGEPVLPGEARTIHMWAEKLGGVVPRPRDVVEVEGVRYAVQSVQTAGHGTRFRLECVEEVG